MAIPDSPTNRLRALHERLIDEPLPEDWRERHAVHTSKHLAHLAMHAAEAGATVDQWRAWAASTPVSPRQRCWPEAEKCMHSAGLWPWHD